MKRNLIIAAVLAAFAGVAVASNTQYNNEAGEQDLRAPIASSDQYRNDAGEQDAAVSIAKNDEYNNDAGQRDEHAPQVG
jgi:hypothetical protein